MACTVAPKYESKKLPKNPVVVAIRNTGNPTACGTSQAKTPMNKAAEKANKLPNTDTAPEVPGGTVLPVVIKRGGVLLSTPNSVAQVSAFTVARAAAKAAQANGKAISPLAAPSRANTGRPPLAATWAQSRRPPLAKLAAALRLRSA